MSTKEKVIAMIADLPEEATLDDIEYHLFVRRKALRGLDDVRTGKTVTHEELKKRLAKWDEQ